MRWGVVVFPGSNDDRDALRVAERVLGDRAVALWHKDRDLQGVDCVILPGGFSYGDYLRCGAMAKYSPIMDAVRGHADAGGLVLGTCNGFQILCEAGLLPGALVRNRSLSFVCETVWVRVERSDTPFTFGCRPGEVLALPIKHGEGCYVADEATLAALERDGQIIFRYVDRAGRVVPEANPNGSLGNIAGVCNAARNVVGLMPHPEHAVERLTGGEDGLKLFRSVQAWLQPGGAVERREPGMLPRALMARPVTVETAAEHGLTAEEYAKIVEHLGRAPTLEEIGVFGAMWSEHCSYKSSRAFLRQLPTTGPQVLQGPGENAGAVDIGDGLAAIFKIESHNHPSFIEPFQGAATGVGGILRDIFTMGARPVASLDALRFGTPDRARMRYLVKGVVAGIGHYGNCIGVPTVGGDLYFDPGYDHNILVNAFTIGIAPRDRIVKAKAEGVGNPVMYVGARTGRDGIHGASLLASAEFDAAAADKRPAVQVGDPFTEKLLLEACLTLMQTDHLVAVQDMGAAGLTSSSLEMAGRGGAGMILDLDRVPLREEGMTPYEVLLSESQERMLLVVKAGHEAPVQEVFARWVFEACVIGRLTDDGTFRARWHGDEVCSIPVTACTEAAPVYRRPAEEPARLEELQKLDLAEVREPGDYTHALLSLLESPNLCCREWVYRQYDQLVGGNTVVRPGGDAALVRIEGTQRALALTVDCNSRYCQVDPYLGAVLAVVEAARNVVAVGAQPLAISDCLNYGNPEKPDVMWEFQQGIQGIRDACLALGTPVVSGNVSFYNDTEGKSIPPTPMIAMVGLLDDVEAHVTPWWKAEGDVVILLGRTREELGASEYLAFVHGIVRGAPPWIDLEAEKRLHRVCLAAAQERVLRSAHDVAEGGLAVALAECSFGGPQLGVRVALERGIRTDALLFGESQSRMLLSVRRRHLGRLRDLVRREEVPFTVLGEVRGQSLVIGDLVDLPLAQARERWRRALERRLAG